MKEKIINIIQILSYTILFVIIIGLILVTGFTVEYLILELLRDKSICNIIKLIIWFPVMLTLTILTFTKSMNLIEEFGLYFIRKDHERSIDKGPIYFCINLSKMSYYMDEETCKRYMSDIYITMKHLPVTIYTYSINYNEWNY